jgi:YVTN family beta-propeller protein
MFGSAVFVSGLKTQAIAPQVEKYRLSNAPRNSRPTRWLGLLGLLLLLGCAGRTAAQNVTSTVTTNHEAVAIDVISSQNTIYVTTGDNTLTAINGATNAVTVFNDPAAANTNGAGAMVTYYNGVLVLNKTSNNITSYYAYISGNSNQEQVQQVFSEPNTNQPVAIVLDPVNFGRIFVANAGSNSVSIFDNVNGNGWQLTASLTNIPDPQAMVINVNTHQVFVTSGNTNTVTVIDGTSNSVRGTVQVGTSPKSLAFNTATNQVYVADANAQSIVDIDANSLATTTISIPNSIPTAIAVNPVTNQIFEVSGTGLMSIIDGATNTVTRTVSLAANDSPSGQAAVVVDPTTNIAYVEISGAQLYIVDGGTGSIASVSSGTGGNAVLALNPITHKVYIDNGASGVTVIDGATNVAGGIQPGQTQPYALAVNPATNKIYVANFGSSTVSVIDGATNTVTTEVTTDSNPNAIAVDPARNLIFATNFNSSSATIIDGSNNTPTSQFLNNANPDSIAVNPVIGRVFGASSTQNIIFGFLSDPSGGNLNFYPSYKTGPIAVAYNAATGVNFELDSGGVLEADDGAFPARGITFVCSGSTPMAMDVNPVTNKVYVACSSGEIDAVVNAGGFSNGGAALFQDPAAVKPAAVAVNSATNQIFIANAGDGSGNGSLTVLDANAFTTTNIPLSGTPVALAVNVATNKIYVQSQVSASTSAIIVVDGASQLVIASIGAATAGPLTQQLAINPAAGEIYAVNRTAGNVAGTLTTITENVTQSDRLTTTITPFAGNSTTSVTPTFNFTVTNTLDGGTAYVVYYQIDTQSRDWNFGSNISGQNFSGSLTTPLTPGYHIVYAYAVAGDETSGNSSNNGVGFQNNPIVGSVASYGFMVAPPISGGTVNPMDFGSQASGSQGTAQRAILTSVGAGPVSFTYTITGANAADFKEVPYTGTDTLCNTLGGSLPSSNYCDVNIAFQPSTAGPETATLTFTTNSLSVPGTPQTVILTGTGTAAAQEPLTVTFSGSGKVTDNAGLLNCTTSPCTQNYIANQVVILTAAPNTGSTFVGWSGACTGSGTCTVNMSQAQAVTAAFVTNGAGTCGANDAIWVGGASGNWSVATNWSTGIVPNNFVNVCINNNHSPVSSVTLDINTNIGNLTINPANSLTIGNNLELVVAGNIANSGHITLTSNNANTFLIISGAIALTGGGTITMNQATSNGQPIINSGQPIIQNQNHGNLTNVNNLIEGSGQIGNNGLIVNNLAGGVINANAAFALGLNTNTLTNQGVLEATAAGVLQISEAVINKGGTITAKGGAAAVQLYNGTTIQGGTLTNAGGSFGTVAGNGATLDGTTQGALTLAGIYSGLDDSTTILGGTINNTGTLQLTSAADNVVLTLSGAVTLTGGGTVLLNQTAGGVPILNNTNAGVLNNFNNRIEGAGQIGNNGLVLNNQADGVILANASQPLILNSSPVNNAGLIVADGSPNPGFLQVNSYTQTSTGDFGIAIGGTTAGNQYSQWQNSGTATLAGSLDIQFLGGFVPAAGNQFTILTSGSITGTFSKINSPSLPSGLVWSVTYNPTSVVLSVIAGTGSGSETLTVSDLGLGSGTVTDDLGLINCTTTAGVVSGSCSGSYATNSVVVLTATPVAGTTFSGWNACAGTATCSVTMNGAQSVNATFVPTGSTYSVSVITIGTGNGSVTDNLGEINCTTAAGVQSGTCSGSYAGGSVVTLTATPTGTSTFAGFGGACAGLTPCSLTVAGPESVNASFAPAPQLITLSFAPGTTVTGMATYDCPSNPNPSPTSPCLDPNAHSLALSVPTVITPFTLTVQATEVPRSVADGICPNGATPTTDFDCRFVSFFTYQTNQNGDKIVPLCYPYANGNCVHYLVYSGQPGTEPSTSAYMGPIDWTISWNNDHFTPPAPYLGSTPRVYDDPDYAVTSTSPFGTNCSTAMLVGNPPVATNPPIFCQFEFDITTFFNPTKPVDATIGARTKQFNDVVVAFPPANAGLVTVTNTPDGTPVVAGNALGFTIAIANNSGGAAVNGTLQDPLPAGTGVSWSISPAYAGPGTCAINGAVGAQELDCTFGSIAVNTSFTIHVVSASSSAGTYSDAASVTVTNQQVLSIGTITVTPATIVTAFFTGLTPSQSVAVGTSSITLSGAVAGGNIFAAVGKTVSITINGVTQPATIGANGTFSKAFPTAAIPVSATPYVIMYSYPGDANLSAATDSSTTLTVTPLVQLNFTLTVTEIGTGNGTVTDGQGLINCVTTAGVSSGTCSAIYPSGTPVTLTATPAGTSTFAGYSGACSGTGACNISMTANQAVTASFAPPPQMITLSYAPGTTVQNMATYDCPSNPNPSPTSPCLDPNAHSLALAVPTVLTPFTLTVQATEVPPSVADGICPNGDTPTQDFDCRFASFFTYQTLANGNKIVPLCYPYANGNCVHYLVYSGQPGTEPPTSAYVGPIDWTISWNNDHFTPPAPYLGSTPRVYDDPDYAVSNTAPFGTNCSTAMQVGNPPVATNPPIFCQFEFDITTFFNPTKPVDATIGARTKQFNDVVVAFPPANAGLVTVTNTPDSATVVAGNPIGFTVAIANNSGGTAVNATLKDPLPAGPGVSWSISPAYAGPGTCALSGAVGAQELDCTLGSIAVNTSFSIHLSSASSSIGAFTNAASVTVTNQQVLSIGTITVTGVSQTIAFTISQTSAVYNSTFPVSATASSGLPVTIAASGSCSLASGTVTMTSGTGTCTLTVSQAGNTLYGAAPNVVHTVAATLAAQTITLSATPASAVYHSTFAATATASSALPVTIVGSGSCAISAGTVTMTSGTGTCTLTATQAGNGNYSAAPQIVRTVAAQKAASAASITANSPNPSTTGQAVSISFKVTGTTTPTGSVSVAASTGETCSGALSAGAGSCSITFATAGPRTLVATYGGDANFTSNASPAVSQTVNTGTTSTLSISPSSVSFGKVLLGFLGVKNVTLKNTGSTPIAISRIAMSKTGTGEFADFSVVSLCPGSLGAGKSCEIVVAFVPLHDNPAGVVSTSSVLVTDNAAGSPQAIPVSAQTINPHASLSALEVGFPTPQAVGTISPSKTVTVTNTGSSPLILGTISFNGLGDFVMAGGSTCAAGTTLAPTQQCTINIAFAPKAKGIRLGAVEVADNSLRSPIWIRLIGKSN